jgi:hypothetical protein
MQSIARLPHFGLPADPVAAKPAAVTVPDSIVVTLPYMGPSIHDDTVGQPYPTEQLNFKRYAAREQIAQASRTEDFDDPCDILMRKVSHMARLLGCTEKEAENILFDRLG